MMSRSRSWFLSATKLVKNLRWISPCLRPVQPIDYLQTYFMLASRLFLLTIAKHRSQDRDRQSEEKRSTYPQNLTSTIEIESDERTRTLFLIAMNTFMT